MTTTQNTRLAVIGGGPAGYTAALYAARAGLSPVCIEGFESGGQIVRSPRVDNFPGQPGGISGAELGGRIREQAVEAGAQVLFDDVLEADLSAGPFRLTTTSGTLVADAVVVATGAVANRLGLPSEDAFDGRGVAYCAVCDGPFFSGKRVVVVGGGDAALEEALALREIASSVTLVHRRESFRASAHTQAAVAAAGDIDFVLSTVVDEILGDDTGVTGVRLRGANGAVREIDTDGVFICIGHTPASGLFRTWLECDDHGFIVTRDRTTRTNVPGVFAAGDVADPRYRQAITAASSGCQAAIDAERWLLTRAAVPAQRSAPRDLVPAS